MQIKVLKRSIGQTIIVFGTKKVAMDLRVITHFFNIDKHWIFRHATPFGLS
jgi:hypothetical protein